TPNRGCIYFAASTIAMNLQCISFWDCEKSRVTTARSDFCRGGLNTGIIRERHSKWSTTPFRQVRETHQERSGKVPTQPIRSRPRPIRNDRGSCQQRDLPSNAPSLSWCRAGAFHLQAPAEVPAAVSNGSRDATRRSPAVIRSFHQGDRQASYARAPRRFRQESRLLKWARRELRSA